MLPAPPAKLPMRVPPKLTLLPETPISPAPVPWLRIATVSCVKQAGDRQPAAVEVVVGVGEGDIRSDDLRGGILEKRDRRREAGQGGNRVRHLLVLRVVRGQKPSCELRPPPPRSPHRSSRGMPVFPLRFAGKSLATWALAQPSAALFDADELRHGLDVACRMLRSTAEFEHETRAAGQCRLPMAFIAREHWSARHPETILRAVYRPGVEHMPCNVWPAHRYPTMKEIYRCNLHSSPAY